MTENTQDQTASRKPELRIDSVRIEWIPDNDPDLSWLDQTDEQMGEGFEAQSKEREESYGQSWEMLGCVAKATFAYPFESNLGVRLESFTSGGLWGIESDMDNDTREEYENQQLSDLVDHLSHFGIETSVEELRGNIQ